LASARQHAFGWYREHGATMNDIVVVFDDMAAFWTFGREAYHATFGDYDLGCKVGIGATPLEAIADLLDQVQE